MMSTDRDKNWDGVIEGRTTAAETAVTESLADVGRFAAAARLAPGMRQRLSVVVDEIISNIVIHGAPPVGSVITWKFQFAEDALRLVFTDAGAQFDPRGAVAPLPDDEAAIVAAALERTGGLGWRLVLAWCDIVAYEREDGRNRLELKLRSPLNAA